MRRLLISMAIYFLFINDDSSCIQEEFIVINRVFFTTTYMENSILTYHDVLSPLDREICTILHRNIEQYLPDATSKVWHGHPVWFLHWNPIVGYSKLKERVQLLFWSGQSFEEEWLKAVGSFEAAQISYISPDEIDPILLARWLAKSRDIQWDYQNIVKRNWKLERLL